MGIAVQTIDALAGKNETWEKKSYNSAFLISCTVSRHSICQQRKKTVVQTKHIPGTCKVLPAQWHQCEAKGRRRKVAVQQKSFVMMAVTPQHHRKVTVSVLPCLLEQLGQIE